MLAVLLAVGTVAALLVPGLHVETSSLALELVVDTVGTVVAVIVATLCWTQSDSGEPAFAFQAAAFSVIALGSASRLAIVLENLHLLAARSLPGPGPAGPAIVMAAQVAAAVLLLAGSIAARRGVVVAHRAIIVVGSLATMVAIAVVIGAVADRLPPLTVPRSPAVGQGPASATYAPAVVGTAISLLAGSVYLLAAVVWAGNPRTGTSRSAGYVTLALVIAACAEVHAAAFGTILRVVTSGDLLYLAFGIAMLIGIRTAERDELRQLRGAHDRRSGAATLVADRAAIEERARLSRELHDGLAQELWVAKLKTARLAALPDLGSDARALSADIEHAVDAGLADAQQAVAALRLSGPITGTLSELLARTVAEFGDRFGLRVEYQWEAGVATLPPRAQAEALRVVQEALTNIRRHADATVARVHARIDGGNLVLVVADNGRGFDPDTAATSAYGLASMRERAAMIGGQLRIESRPHDGTRLHLVVPLLGPTMLASAPTS